MPAPTMPLARLTVAPGMCERPPSGGKLAPPPRKKGGKQLSDDTKLKALKKTIYNEILDKCHYASGEWTPASSDMMRREHDWMAKYEEGCMLCEKVMGSSAYHSSPVVLICPFDTCKGRATESSTV